MIAIAYKNQAPNLLIRGLSESVPTKNSATRSKITEICSERQLVDLPVIAQRKCQV